MTATKGLLGVFALFTTQFSVFAGDTLPRYRFEPGQEIAFRFSSLFKYGEGKTAGEHGFRDDWTIWVVRANPDGSFHLIAREQNTFSQTVDGKKMDQPAQTNIVHADIFPDGKVVMNKTIQFRGNPEAVFPLLPPDAAQFKAGWQCLHGDEKVTFKPLDSIKGFVFESETDSPMNKIYLSSNKSKYTFDASKGFVTKIESETTQGYGFKGKGTGSTELVSIKTMEPAALQAFVGASDRYFAAMAAYEAKTIAAGKTAPEQAKNLLATAVKDLKDAAAGVKSNQDLWVDLTAKAMQHEQMEKYYLEGAERRAKVMGKPAAEFEIAAIDGKKVKLADLRGQVVVLDFWYRGCGWCIKAMPQMNQLADDFVGKPVAIFGMNTDRDEADAKFVIEKMALKYPTLKAEGIPERFGVQGFPTLIVIDQQGKVHDIHVGYSPTLREEVGRQIKELLAKN
jgi:peroxiredoxin